MIVEAKRKSRLDQILGGDDCCGLRVSGYGLRVAGLRVTSRGEAEIPQHAGLRVIREYPAFPLKTGSSTSIQNPVLKIINPKGVSVGVIQNPVFRLSPAGRRVSCFPFSWVRRHTPAQTNR